MHLLGRPVQADAARLHVLRDTSPAGLSSRALSELAKLAAEGVANHSFQDQGTVWCFQTNGRSTQHATSTLAQHQTTALHTAVSRSTGMVAADKLTAQACCSRVPGTQLWRLPVPAPPHRTAHSRACLRRTPRQACHSLAAGSAGPEAAQLDTMRAQADAAVQTDASGAAGPSGLQPEPARAPPVLRSRLEVRRQTSGLAANPLSFVPVHRAGAFSGGSGLESGGALTSSMVAHAVGTSVEQVSRSGTRSLEPRSALLLAKQGLLETAQGSPFSCACWKPWQVQSQGVHMGRADTCALPAQLSATVPVSYA